VGYAFIKHELFHPATVAVGLGVGGIAMLLIEPRVPRTRITELDAVTWRVALVVGLVQCLALWPGVSRSAATILGAMLIGVGRKTAAEYSFFAAVPVLVAATAFDLLHSSLHVSDAPVFAVGFVVALASAWFGIKFFIHLLGAHTLSPFGWYRILVAPLVLLVVR
jgi:undecaprenyl-diphosphatase